MARHSNCVWDGKQAILAVQKAPLTAETLSLLEPRHDSQHSVAVYPKLPDQIASPALALPTKAPEYASQPAASAERRVALVIGNSEYSSAAFLPNPRRDAKAVADALREVGLQTVDLALDLDRDATVKTLRAFRDQADKADWALIYFAGHGIEMSSVNYLVPIDAKLFDDRDVKTETVSYEELLDAARGAKMLRLLVLDACRVNPFKDSMRRTMASRGSNDRGLAPPPEAEPGTLVVYSAKDGEIAADDIDGVNSPFARAFVAELKVPGLECGGCSTMSATTFWMRPTSTSSHSPTARCQDGGISILWRSGRAVVAGDDCMKAVSWLRASLSKASLVDGLHGTLPIASRNPFGRVKAKPNLGPKVVSVTDNPLNCDHRPISAGSLRRDIGWWPYNRAHCKNFTLNRSRARRSDCSPAVRAGQPRMCLNSVMGSLARPWQSLRSLGSQSW
jgi:hypothetical protein